MNPSIIGADDLPYKSPPQNWASGGALSFAGFVPKRGPNGGRVVIDSFDLIANATDVTQATTAIEGEDVYRFVKRIQVEQFGGLRRYNIRGDELRQFLYHHAGGAEEFADVAASANQALKWTFAVPMAKPATLEPLDTSLPADLFRQFVIECADTAETAVGGGTTTITAMQYYLVAHCHEEFSVVLKAEDEVVSTLFPSTAGGELKIGGRLHDLVLFARGASGGAAMTNLTDVIIDELRPSALLNIPDLTMPWIRAKGAFRNGSTDGAVVRNDPVGATRAVPVIFSGPRTSVYDGKAVESVNVRLTNSVASVIAIHRNMKPRSGEVARAVMDTFGLSQRDFRVKTHGKTRQDVGDWNKQHVWYLPLVAPLPREQRL